MGLRRRRGRKDLTSVKKSAWDATDKLPLIVTPTYIHECQRALLCHGPYMAT